MYVITRRWSITNMQIAMECAESTIQAIGEGTKAMSAGLFRITQGPNTDQYVFVTRYASEDDALAGQERLAEHRDQMVRTMEQAGNTLLETTVLIEVDTKPPEAASAETVSAETVSTDPQPANAT